MSAVRGSSFPLNLTFCAYVVLTEGRGSGEGRIHILAADDESVIYPGTAHQLVFSPNPLAITAAIFRIPCCTFPKPGLYTVQFMYNGVCLADQPLRVEEQP